MFTVCYAYPSSTNAAMCGAEDTGCYVVKRTHSLTTGKQLKSPVLAVREAFHTKEAAEAWIGSF